MDAKKIQAIKALNKARKARAARKAKPAKANVTHAEWCGLLDERDALRDEVAALRAALRNVGRTALAFAELGADRF